MTFETPTRLELMRLSSIPEQTAGLIAELSASGARLGHGLHAQSAANLADLVRVMNAYYTNLIEGHHTRPRDIERAMSGDLDAEGPIVIFNLKLQLMSVYKRHSTSSHSTMHCQNLPRRLS